MNLGFIILGLLLIVLAYTITTTPEYLLILPYGNIIYSLKSLIALIMFFMGLALIFLSIK